MLILYLATVLVYSCNAGDVQNFIPFITEEMKHWPYAEIPYHIEPSIGRDVRTQIQNAITEFEKYTCLRFPSRRRERHYINFKRGNGCTSAIGRHIIGGNNIALAPGCWNFKTIMHVIGHAIGLHHEQNRADRDRYVWIYDKNIPLFDKGHFKKENFDTYGTKYDYDSIMHSGPYAYGKGKQTLKAKNQRYRNSIGKQVYLSETDKIEINKMYHCHLPSRSPPTARPPYITSTATGRPNFCDNKERKCFEWAQNGYCNDVKEGDRMQSRCCKACKENAICPNKQEKCQQWADEGECIKNSHYMHKNCRKACKLCY